MSNARAVVVVLLVVALGTGCGGGPDNAPVDASPDGVAACTASDASYTACGCGCCAGAPPSTRCLDRAHGETLDSVAQADRTAASSPGCAQTGCSAPIVFVCCE